MSRESEQLREIAGTLIKSSEQLRKEADDLIRRAEELEKSINKKAGTKE
jgi:hypothetical protein